MRNAQAAVNAGVVAPMACNELKVVMPYWLSAYRPA